MVASARERVSLVLLVLVILSLKAVALPGVLGLSDPTKWYGDDVKKVAKGIPTLDINSVGVIPHELLMLSPCAAEIDADHRIVRYIAAAELLVYLEELR